MTTTYQATPFSHKFAALGLAFSVTLAMLAGIDTLAAEPQPDALFAQAGEHQAAPASAAQRVVVAGHRAHA